MILIIDDDRAIRLSLSLLLERSGYKCQSVSTEEEALKAARSPELQLVILDMNLTLSTTGRQGIDLIRKLRIIAPQAPLIMLSAWGTVPLAVEGMGFGAVDFIPKPWDNRDVVAKVKRALEAAADSAAKAAEVVSLEETERRAILKALRTADGNLSEAAALLGITRQSLYRRMKKYKL